MVDNNQQGQVGGVVQMSVTPALDDAGAIIDWLTRRIAEIRDVPVGSVRPEERFSRNGLDSLAVTTLLAELSRHMGRAVPTTAAWAYPTPAALAKMLAVPDGPAPQLGIRTRLDAAAAEPVAMVGLACRMPGADNPDELWQLLIKGRDAVGEVPPQRWAIDDWYDPDPTRAGKIATRRGGFLRGIDGFDPLFFGISPGEARHMDPQQRLMLELAWEALADAGIPPSSLRGRSIGVFIGAMWTDYAAVLGTDPERIGMHTATGGDTSIIAARISYTFGLTGPSITINTACSSSLVALHQARRSLLAGECDLALVGGVSLMVTPTGSVAMSRFGAMAPDGRCKAFDASADGYVRGEGGGLVVLKPLSAARADGDHVYCCVVGSAVNNDGFSNGLTAPSPQAQEAVIRAACADAGIAPADVDYVETHGTGTRLGDPIEAGALATVYGAGRNVETPLLLGAVKTNLGHLEAAAGAAGLIKTALALHHRQIPGNLHFEQPSPHIPFQEWRLAVPTALRPWPESDHPAMAGVSSFGFGGTNCHVLLRGVRTPPRPTLSGSGQDPVFVFGGQGSQWAGAGVELMAEPAFARAVSACDRAMAPYLGGSITDALTQRADWLRDTAWIQPAIFTMQVALAALWESWGVRPAAVIGMSMGEVAAAHVSGALGLQDAARVICLRARLVGQAAGAGAMAVVELGADELDTAASVSIAVLGSPGRTVVSGTPADLERACLAWEQRGVIVRRVDVDYASHSPQMDPLLPLLRQELAGLVAGPTHIPFWSTVTGGPLFGTELDAGYWCRNLREPVRFAPTVTALGAALFLEVDAHPVALRDIADCLPEAVALPSMRRDESAYEVLSASAAFLVQKHVVPAEMPLLLPISAHSEPALTAAAASMADRLRAADRDELTAVCHTATAHRDHHEFRLAMVIAPGSTEHIAALDAFAGGDAAPAVLRGRVRSAARPVFVFPGQGGQFPEMGIELYRREPVFRRAAHRCALLIRAESGIDLSPWLTGTPLPADAGMDTIQPALFTIGVALAALWRSWGVEPAAVVGHSMGEVAAAHVCGALSLPDAVRVICRRSAVYARLAGRGAMALVELSHEQARAVIADRAGLEIAALNESRSTVLTGEPDAIAELIESLHAKGIMARRIAVDAAAHSRQVEPLLAEFRASLLGLEPRSAAVPFISTVTATAQLGHALDAEYWARNLREPVRFADAVGQVSAAGPVCFLELGPHPTLTPIIREPAVAALHRDIDSGGALITALATAYTHGVELDWQRLPLPVARRTSLPDYPWQRERYWITDAAPDAAADDRVDGPCVMDADDIRRYLAARLGSLLGMPAQAVPFDTALAALGATSLMAMELRNLIAQEWDVEVLVSQVLEAAGLDELADTVLELGAIGLSEVVPVQADTDRDVFGLTGIQRRLWFLQQLDLSGLGYTFSYLHRIDGSLDPAVFGRALNTVVAAQAGLRTGFAEQAGDPVQFVVPDASLRTEVAADRRAFDDFLVGPFDLAHPPLLRSALVRTGPDSWLWGLTMHHLIADGWTYALIVRQLSAVLAGDALPVTAADYGDFVDYERTRAADPRRQAALEHWAGLLADLPTAELPHALPRPPLRSYTGRQLDVTLPAPVGDRLRALAASEEATLFAVLLAVHTVVLAKYTGVERVSVGTPYANRPQARFHDTAGCFVSTLVLPMDLTGQLSFRQLTARTARICATAWDHADFPYEQLVERLAPERDTSRNVLFQSFFALQDIPVRLRVPGASTAPEPFDTGITQFDVEIYLTPSESGELALSMRYNTDLFTPADAADLILRWQLLADRLSGAPEGPVSGVSLLSEQERAVITAANRTAMPYQYDRRADELFAARAAADGDRLALVCGPRRLTYRELDALVEDMTGVLNAAGASRTRVGIRLPRSPEMVAAVLATMRVGATYVPLDPDAPDARLASVTANSGIRFTWGAEGLEVTGSGPDDCDAAAYILHTSGSTGTPKGVQVGHPALINLLTSMSDRPGLADGDVLVAVTGLTFDIATLELLAPLINGATLVVATQEQARDPRLLTELLDEVGATVMQATPSSWRMLLDTGWAGRVGLRAWCGGESLHRDLADRLSAVCDEVWNLYGPTETTIWSARWRVGPDGPVRIGDPIGNTGLHVLDRHGVALPPGIPGELVISGDGLADGYLGLPEETAARFSTVTIEDERTVRGYHTGDLVRRLPDGSLVCLGRTDDQLKVRGHRVEPAEVEQALRGHPSIREAVVVHTPSDQLVAHLLSGDGPDPTEQQLRAHLTARLPAAIIPERFVIRAELPRTTNGKIDRVALRNAPLPTDTAEVVQPPQNSDESLVADLYREFLSVRSVGRHDDFFQLGGNSLIATRVLYRLEAARGVRIPLHIFMRDSTVAALAQQLTPEQLSDKDNDALQQALALLDSLSESEAAAIAYDTNPVEDLR